MQQSAPNESVHRSFTSDEAALLHDTPAVMPSSSNLKALGERWTLSVTTQVPINEACAAEAPGAADWRTTKGLGLYIVSTILLSIQATAAKVLGKCCTTQCNTKVATA